VERKPQLLGQQLCQPGGRVMLTGADVIYLTPMPGLLNGQRKRSCHIVHAREITPCPSMQLYL
jgi:hypothetical protein